MSSSPSPPALPSIRQSPSSAHCPSGGSASTAAPASTPANTSISPTISYQCESWEQIADCYSPSPIFHFPSDGGGVVRTSVTLVGQDIGNTSAIIVDV